MLHQKNTIKVNEKLSAIRSMGTIMLANSQRQHFNFI